MFCPICGVNNTDDTNYCTGCGRDLHPLIHISTSQYTKRYSFKSWLIIISAVALFIFISASAAGFIINKMSMVLDANRFCRISSEELMQIMGEPFDYIYDDFKSERGKAYSAEIYIYKSRYLGERQVTYNFALVDNSVVGLYIYFDKGIYFKDVNNLMKKFNIKPSKEIKIEEYDGTFLKYSPVSNRIIRFSYIVFGSKYSTSTSNIQIFYKNDLE